MWTILYMYILGLTYEGNHKRTKEKLIYISISIQTDIRLIKQNTFIATRAWNIFYKICSNVASNAVAMLPQMLLQWCLKCCYNLASHAVATVASNEVTMMILCLSQVDKRISGWNWKQYWIIVGFSCWAGPPWFYPLLKHLQFIAGKPKWRGTETNKWAN